ncbi:MAG: 23S rRNA (pseudouridine(1915)-N(3))-methyltransferase RlmH [Epulopiscium sp.]|nr:23S rRNA (pseudouridine(1915)-N(3))-methyltransferase RlmH [Candidatus Epulonipiscium sp.]
MNITIIAIGKIKEAYLKDGIAEYKKRISKHCNIEIIELEDEKAPENMSLAQEEEVKQKEGNKILKYIKNSDGYIISLAIQGKQYTSGEFASHLKKLGLRGKESIIFIIGGSLGLSDEVLKISNEHISFSKMTFPHQLMRLILLEQISRLF